MASLRAESVETWMLECKRIAHLILLFGNMVERDIIEELNQLLDLSLIGYQLMIPSLPLFPQLVNHQG